MFGVSMFNPTSDAKAFVFALRNQREVSPYIPDDADAIAVPPRYPLYLPVIVLSIDSLGYDRTAIMHELAHVISFNALWPQPNWFAEGLAVYFEAAHLDEEDGAFDLGAPSDDRLRRLRAPQGLTRVADMLACADGHCEDLRFYASAWALFAYLANYRPAELLRYVQRLADLAPQAQATRSPEVLIDVKPAKRDPQAQAIAWSQAFPDVTPAELDHTLSHWIHSAEFLVHRYKVKFKDFSITQRSLSDGDVYTARAVLSDRLDPTKPVAPDVSAAIAIDPTNVIAQMIRSVHDHRSASEVARSLTAAHPDDWRAWWLFMLAAKDGEEADTGHARFVRSSRTIRPCCRRAPVRSQRLSPTSASHHEPSGTGECPDQG
jgi:hypothetical protein